MTPSARLLAVAPGAPPRVLPIIKSLTTLGETSDCDLQLPGVQGVVTIECDHGLYTASALEGATLVVNGKRRVVQALHDGDRLQIGPIDLEFRVEARTAAPSRAASLPSAPTPGDSSALAVRRLAELAGALAREPSTDRALSLLLDAVIEVTRADKGFLIVLEGGVARVQLARNMNRTEIPGAVGGLSDSILRRVIETRRPVIVSDALHDAQFNASESVVNLKLCSVLCAPLLRRGELHGAIYVGNDRVASLFTEHELTLLTSFCSTAALLLERALELDELRAEKRELQTRLEEQTYGEILGACDAMRDIFRKIDRVAGTDISVLITGDTGTGKELIARELHRRSARKNGPFVAINCGAIPEALLESELFGHAKGAFTGAITARPGRFQAASGGTLFLDEIGEMPAALQVKLLRALQERVVTRVGESRTEAVDIRVLSATNKDLDVEMKEGRFREDLYYRLNVICLHLPPLRERGEDAVLLAKWFLGRTIKELGSKVKGFSPQAQIAIKRFGWPGNIRQLENRIKKAVVLADSPWVGPEDLELRPENLEPILPLLHAREEWQKRYINEVLERNGGNRTKTAKDLGVDPRTIFRHLEKQESDRGDGPGLDGSAEGTQAANPPEEGG